MILLGIVLVIVVLILVFAASASTEKKTDDDNIIESTGVVKSSSTIHFSNDFSKKDHLTLIEKEHTIIKILMANEDKFTWVCSNCETENLLSKTSCSVCNKEK